MAQAIRIWYVIAMTRALPTTLSLPRDVRDRLDAAAEADARSRSAMAALLLRRGLDTSPAPPPAAPPPAAQEPR